MSQVCDDGTVQMLPYEKSEFISLARHPELNEKWIQQRIAIDPKILGLGDLILKDRERMQPRAGRLDLLLQDPETDRRFEVELQLGATDESHIIRTVEYWDIERKRYPQYDHIAVLIAEDITSRFLNVISLLHGSVPLIAIQMRAIQLAGHMSLLFTTVLDEMPLGPVDEDEPAPVPVDRSYWAERVPAEVLKVMDSIIALIVEFRPRACLNYNKEHVGIAENGITDNFVFFYPRKKYVIVCIKLPRSDETDQQISASDIESISYHKMWRSYRLRVTLEKLEKNRSLIRDLICAAAKRNQD